jgi:hypothetical protein
LSWRLPLRLDPHDIFISGHIENVIDIIIPYQAVKASHIVLAQDRIGLGPSLR